MLEEYEKLEFIKVKIKWVKINLNTSLSTLNYSRYFPLHHSGCCIISLRFKGKDFFEQFFKKPLIHFKNQKHFPVLSESKEFWDGALLEIFLVPMAHDYHEKTLCRFLMLSSGLVYMWLFNPLWHPRERTAVLSPIGSTAFVKWLDSLGVLLIFIHQKITHSIVYITQ